MEVLLMQKPGFGINYRELNKLMIDAKNEQQEFLAIKKDLEDQFMKALSKVTFDVEIFRNDRKNLSILLEEEKIKNGKILQEMKDFSNFLIK
jgi:hypothetical protein